MVAFLSQPWPWYVAGPLLGLFVPALLILGNRQFGFSSNLRHMCAALAPGDVDFFRYDWKQNGLWNLVFLAGTGATTVTVTPWPSLQIPDGLEYLNRYPYGCAEQTISTSFPLLALSDLGQQLAPGMFARERMTPKIQAGILRLIGMQRSDGGLLGARGVHRHPVHPHRGLSLRGRASAARAALPTAVP